MAGGTHGARSNGCFKRYGRRRTAIAFASALATLPVVAAAQTDNWTGNAGSSWSNAGNWSNGVPTTANETVNIVNANTTSINYDYSGAAVTFSILTLDNTAGGAETLSMSNFNLSSNNIEYVGYSGKALFNQSGGVNSTDYISVGPAPGSTGTYTLGGTGTISAFIEEAGFQGSGLISQVGGTNNVLGEVDVGEEIDSSGNFVISGGTTTETNSAGGVYIGGNSIGADSGVGTLTVSNTGTLDEAGTIEVYSGSLINLSGGTIMAGTLNFNNNFNQFHWTSGTLNITNSNVVLDSPSAIDDDFGTSFALQNGQTLLVSNPVYGEGIGNNGTGAFTQTGGANSAAGNVAVGGYTLTGAGTYTISGGLLSVGNLLYVGEIGPGTFTQSGNSIVAAGQVGPNGGLVIGEQASGAYTLNGGELTVGNSATTAPGYVATVLGYYGTGSFTQTAGAFTSIGEFDVAYFPNSQGTYTLSGGTSYVEGDLVLGGFDGAMPSAGGSGTLNVNTSNGASLLTVTGTLYAYPGSTINFQFGKIQAGALNLSGDYSDFNWTVGTLEITNTDLTIDASVTGPADPLGPNVTITGAQTFIVDQNETIGGSAGGSLTIDGTHIVGGTVTLASNGTFTQNSGAYFSAPSFIQNGGIITGTFTNTGSFTYNGGLFNGRLINSGTVSLGNDFTAGDGIENDSSMSLASGQLLILNGAGLDNLGNFTMSGGQIGGTGTVTNDYAGAFSASGGTIFPSFTNNGTLILTGPLALEGGSNFGQIQFDSGGNIRPATVGSALYNNAGGVISGNGGVISATFNNDPGGIIQISAGASLAISHAWFNGGLVSLLGPGAELTGGTITNQATIQGAGEIAATMLNTAGVVTAAGGELSLAGAGNTNTSASQLQASTGDTLFFIQGLATNSGVIALSGGTFDNDNNPMTNSAGAYIEGSGTLKTGALTNSGFTNIDGNFTAFGPVTNASGGSINATDGPNTFFGPITNSGGIGVSPGASIVFLNSFSGTTPVNNNGTVTFNAISTSGAITGAGWLGVGSAGVSASLQLIDNAGLSEQSALTIATGSILDITNNAVLLTGDSTTSELTVQKYIESGSIISTYAAADGLLVAYADGSDGVIAGLPAGEIVIEPALAGDTDLNGTVNIHDLQNLLSDFNAPGYWDQGNFNGHSVVDISDLQALLTNFNTSVTLSYSELAGIENIAGEFGDVAIPNAEGFGFALVSVPEPASMALVLVATTSLLRRRRY
jgi:fibronectin-binding autotransporter adhesin